MRKSSTFATALSAAVLASVVSIAPASAQSVPTCLGLPATIVGTEGNDRLVGTSGRDVIVGLGGNDVILGGEGSDLICGGTGNDTIRGQQKADVISGDAGHDTIYGNWGADTIVGGAGNDRIDGGFGLDEIDGGPGNNWIRGGNHADRIFGGDGDDNIGGGNGHDEIRGLGGDDIVNGGGGVDRLFGGAGNDIINSGLGNDDIFGGNGVDNIRRGGTTGDNIDTGAGLDIVDDVRETVDTGSTTAEPDPDPGLALGSIQCTPQSLTDPSNPVWQGLSDNLFDDDLHLVLVNRVRDVCEVDSLDAAWLDAGDPVTVDYAAEISDHRNSCVARFGATDCRSNGAQGSTWWRHSESGDEHYFASAASASFGATAENIAFRLNGNNGLAGFIGAWINSPGHFCTLINPRYDQLSVSVAEDGEGYRYGVHVFRGDNSFDPNTVNPICR